MRIRTWQFNGRESCYSTTKRILTTDATDATDKKDLGVLGFHPRREGSILIGVLWCMVLLSVLVIGVLHTARMDLLVVKNYGDRVQAHYLALAGVERAKALIYQDVVTRQQTAKNHNGLLYNDAKDFQDGRLGPGRFEVFRRAPEEEGGSVIYGVSDEESRLNLNTATAAEFTNLVGMTPDILAAIIAWRTATGQTPSTAGGANADYYLSLRPPYLPRNGPFQTVRELLMVHGVTRELLLGNDQNQNGFLDTDDDAADPEPRRGKPLPPPRPGWAAFLTVSDTDKNVSADGTDRVNPQTADEASLTGIPGITQAMARAIISYRGQNQLQSLDDLLSVTAQNQNQGNGNGAANGGGGGTGGNQGGGQGGGQGGSGNSGTPVISQQLLEQIADRLTLSTDTDLTGLININTAGLDVLACLPGVDRTLAQAMINYRKSSGFFDNIADLLEVDGMTRAIFKQVAPLITTRSETYRITCEGKINSSGARQRIEAIVHIDRENIETLGYREDL
jgi:competence ComEA-like helix-hairpin-helix protein